MYTNAVTNSFTSQLIMVIQYLYLFLEANMKYMYSLRLTLPNQKFLVLTNVQHTDSVTKINANQHSIITSTSSSPKRAFPFNFLYNYDVNLSHVCFKPRSPLSPQS